MKFRILILIRALLENCGFLILRNTPYVTEIDFQQRGECINLAYPNIESQVRKKPKRFERLT